MIDRYGSVLRVEYITRLGIDGCSDCPWTKKHLPNGRSKRGAVLLSEMVPLQIVAWVPAPAPARLGSEPSQLRLVGARKFQLKLITSTWTGTWRRNSNRYL